MLFFLRGVCSQLQSSVLTYLLVHWKFASSYSNVISKYFNFLFLQFYQAETMSHQNMQNYNNTMTMRERYESSFRINVLFVIFVSFATITTNRHAIFIFNSVLINRWVYEKSQFTLKWSSVKIKDKNEFLL